MADDESSDHLGSQTDRLGSQKKRRVDDAGGGGSAAGADTGAGPSTQPPPPLPIMVSKLAHILAPLLGADAERRDAGQASRLAELMEGRVKSWISLAAKEAAKEAVEAVAKEAVEAVAKEAVEAVAKEAVEAVAKEAVEAAVKGAADAANDAAKGVVAAVEAESSRQAMHILNAVGIFLTPELKDIKNALDILKQSSMLLQREVDTLNREMDALSDRVRGRDLA